MNKINHPADYPAQKIAPPKPPKYLIKVDSNGKDVVTLTNQQKGQGHPMQFVHQDPNSRTFTNTKVSNLQSEEKVFGPAHRYRGKVDSSSESKSNRNENNGIKESQNSVSQINQASDYKVGNRPDNMGLPRAAALRRFQPPVMADNYIGEAMMSQRTAGGSILGSPMKRYVGHNHVPQHDNGRASMTDTSLDTISGDSTVGPENPVVPYNSNVSQCWDDEAGAVYYYNHTSGEASWLPPGS
jgi:hypothetical protein